MTKQELIEQGFKYIATQNCAQKTEVWARFTGWEDAIQYWYYFPEIDQTNPGSVNVISFVSQLGLFEIMSDKMRGDFLKNDIKIAPVPRCLFFDIETPTRRLSCFYFPALRQFLPVVGAVVTVRCLRLLHVLPDWRYNPPSL